MVALGGVTGQQRGHGDTLASGCEGLAICFISARMHGAGTDLLVCRQLLQALQAGMVQGGQCSFRLITRHGQFGSQRAGKYLRGRLQDIQGHLRKNLRRTARIVLVVGQVCRTQAQQRGLFWRLGGSGLFEQLLDTGVRGPGEVAKAGRGRAGASGQ